MKPGGANERGGRHLRILVTSAGRRVELLHSFRHAASALGVELEMLACDLHPEWSSACRAADKAFAVPPASDPGYAEAVLAICEEHGVSLVVPTIDPELCPLATARGQFAESGTTVSVSAPALVAIARDKLHTAEFFAAHGIPSPRTASVEAVAAEPDGWSWPLLAKPRHGSSGRAVQILADPDALRRLPADEPFIVQQLLRGREHTVNMFFDRSGVFRCAVPHERLQIRSGEVEKGVTRRLPQLEAIARQMADALPGPRGALCYQAMVDADGNASVFEINARFGGGYPLADKAGATFARWLIEEALEMPSSANNDWEEGVLMLRYDAALFVRP